jgi:hypothetical protein
MSVTIQIDFHGTWMDYSKAKTKAEAEAWIAKQPNPDQWRVVA